MKAASAVLRISDRVLNIIICIALLIMLLYGGYALWDTIRVYQGAALSDELLNYRPTGANNKHSFEYLKSINPDVCAWVALNATRINYPVVQGEDNTEYMDKDFYGKYSLTGSIFLDYRNRNDFTDGYSLLYGHYMDGGVMFGDIELFRDKAFFDKHGEGKLFTPDATYKLEVFALIETNAYDIPLYTPLSGSEERGYLLSYIRKKSLLYKDIGVSGSDRLLAFSTCSTDETNGRTLIIARVTPLNTDT